MKTLTLICIRWFFYLIVSIVFLKAFVLTSVKAQETMLGQQVIVQFNAGANKPDQENSDQIESRLQIWQDRIGVKFGYVRPFGENGWIIAVKEKLNADRLDEVIEQLNQDPQVKYAEIDAVMGISPP
jgi:hypothetical protein